MAGKSRRSKLTLTTEDLAKLEQLARSRILPKREAQRSEILLRYHAGETITDISRALRMTRVSVSKWVTARVERRHRSVEFTGLLTDLDAWYPPHCTIRIILDNHSAHISKETTAFQATRPTDSNTC